jgi:glycosyltransferase involved in cell wall biosynthesis
MEISVGETGRRVVFVSGVRGDTRRYRTIHPCEQLRQAGIDAVVSHVTDGALPRLIARAEVVVFHRVANDPYIEAQIRSLRRRGALALFDADDLTFDPQAFQWIDSPDFRDPVRARLYQEDLRRNQATLALCDACLTSTDFLARRIQNLGKPARVHRNGFSLEMLARSEQAFRERSAAGERTVIGYASGTLTHNKDFSLIRPALQRVLAGHPRAELWIAGALDPGGGWEGMGERIRRLPLVPWRELPAILAQFDVNLAPLVSDNPFAQSKSEIKFMEAALVRVPTIASPIEAFSLAICSGKNGFLAESEAEWEEALGWWIDNGDERRRIASQAYSDAIAGYHPSHRAEQLVETLDALSAELDGQPLRLSATPKRNPSGERSDPEALADPSLARMAWYTLRHRGPGTLLRQEWVYFRRLLAPLFPFRQSLTGQARKDNQ